MLPSPKTTLLSGQATIILQRFVSAGARLHARLGEADKWAMRSVAVGFSGVVISSALTLDVAHIRDTYEVGAIHGTTAGVFMALSKFASSGSFYPPLFNGHFYAGTRYAPLPIVLPWFAHAMGAGWIVAEKVPAYLFAFLLFGLLLGVLRRLGASVLFSLLLAAGVLATKPGLLAATGLRWDTPALCFQLAAVTLIDRTRGVRSPVGAGILATLGLLSKISAVWAPLAIVAWLAVRDRRKLWLFVASFLSSLGLAAAALQLASNGRIWENIFGLGSAAFTGKGAPAEGHRGLAAGLSRLASDELSGGRVMPLLLLIALFAIAVAGWRRRVSIFHVAFLAAAATLVAAYADPGVGPNHLIDVAVLSVIAVGGLEATLRAAWPRWAGLFTVAVGAATIALAVPFYRTNILPETKVAVRTIIGIGDKRYTPHPLAGYITRRDELLSDDAYVPLSVGRLPVVLDVFMFHRIARLHPRWTAKLAVRIAKHEFDKIVLSVPIESSGRTGPFDAPANRQIARSYRLAQVAKTPANGDYWIYVPTRHTNAHGPTP